MDGTGVTDYFNQAKCVYDNDMVTIITRDSRWAMGLVLVPYLVHKKCLSLSTFSLFFNLNIVYLNWEVL